MIYKEILFPNGLKLLIKGLPDGNIDLLIANSFCNAKLAIIPIASNHITLKISTD